MLNNFFETYPQFEQTGIPGSDIIEQFRSELPEEIISVWETKGWGIAMKGYLRFVNPLDWNDLMRNSYSPMSEPAHVIAATGMGDLLLWENGSIVQLIFRKGKAKVVGRKPKIFFNAILPDWDYAADDLDFSLYNPAVEKLGTPDFDECFGFEPALATGGSEKVENMQRVKIKEHLAMLAQLSGKLLY